MKASDTVTSACRLCSSADNQAEISFKAGIQEVVEWLKVNIRVEQCDPDVMPFFQDYVWVGYDEWQAKLKEWGIE